MAGLPVALVLAFPGRERCGAARRGSAGDAVHVGRPLSTLPVEDGGQVRGLISMGDVTRWVIRSQQEELDTAIGAVKRMCYSNRRG